MVAKTAEKAETVADILDETSQVIEDTLDLMERKASWLKSSRAHILGAALAGLAVGGAVTYLVVSKRISSREHARADQEIEDVRRHYSGTPIVAPKPDLEELAERVAASETVDHIRDERGYAHYNSVPAEPVPADVVVRVVEAPEDGTIMTDQVVDSNVFESDQPDTYWDWDEENARRQEHPDQPYVITADEFNENDTNYEQISLTYYDGDGVLTDNMDQPADDDIVGPVNLLRFGHASGDPLIVYVRNNKLTADFEIAYSPNKYSHEVLGVPDDERELRHSSGRPLRFRDRHDG